MSRNASLARRTLGWVAAAAIGLPLVGGSTASAADKKTERVWKANCASCHGEDGKAQTEKGQKESITDMSSAAFQKKSDADIRNAILNGVNEVRGGIKKEMDPYKDKLKPEQVDALIAYIRAFGH